ncbi:MAG: hypothetical protein JXB10_00685 [Pirellulales bacterium]|nr:hypothetical protein [Pirellulales bacterium]
MFGMGLAEVLVILIVLFLLIGLPLGTVLLIGCLSRRGGGTFIVECPHCRQRIQVYPQYRGQNQPCLHCGRPITLLHQASGSVGGLADDAATRMLLPVGRSGWAIAAGYAGLFAVVVFPAPLALLLGIVAVAHLKKRSDLHGWGRAIFGLVMGGLFTLVLCFFLLMATGLIGPQH